MATPQGTAAVSVFIRNTTTTRPAAITFGVDAATQTASQVWTAVQVALNTTGTIKSSLGSEVSIDRIRVALGTEAGADIVEDRPTSINGSVAGAMLPSNCALLVHKRSATGGRRGRGRIFIPWMIQEGKCSSSGMIDSAEMVTLQGRLDATFTALGAGGVPMRILHQEGSTPKGLPTVVLGLICDSMVSTQRRRLGR